MQDNISIVEADEVEQKFQVLVNDITWAKDTIGKFRGKQRISYDQLPQQLTFVLPDSVTRKEDSKDFYDIVETFIYNILAKRYNHIAYHCQILLLWLNETEETSVSA